MTTADSVKRKRKFSTGILYLLPALILFTVFLFYPMFRTLYLSFFLTNPKGDPVLFNGFQNYIELFHSKEFLLSLKSSFLFVLCTVIPTIIIALFLAVIANEKLKGSQFFRVAFSSSLGVSSAAAAVIWLFLFDPSIGLINHILSLFGVQEIGWVTDKHWALFSISVTTIWMHLGFNFIILLGGLQSISEDLYESSKIDGANFFQQFRNITIPMLSPTLFFVTVVAVINSFQSFGQIDIMTKGGPAGATNLIVYSIYQDAFANHYVGSASAQAMILFAIILIFTLLQFKFGERKVHYQ
ncbi:carbohydrate ABC transporter permease [Heyndrickxia oleronia]|uniref:carbohydrate ABC transporter permease n=1 Tax=Heyndrickxia oleronia TaxID=38875 RepID=UPI0003A3B7E7|nr:sugar ABC transporter permease [Heyndrickxia oleronia]MCI1589945.1 sugar ABC transporter permease [Heyndrickxia oleronia]MCI1611656.1 sugar ABC transporter permease [Heyndrickxia oleronia]MCI1743571.1 sugar ABC transporter permease [Heyndrickxia oleronia]MCI1760178.1 sugar ABC transporter permease [Heyndrickxia oleronia]